MVSTSLAGELNRARVLKTLYANGPLARPELARLTGSTRATIGQIVQPLLDEGLLEEHEPMASGAQGGKPARPVWFSSDGWSIGALLILPEGAQAALVGASGQIISATSVAFDPSATAHSEIIDLLADAMLGVISHATTPVRGIGIAVGGMVDTDAGQILRMDSAPWLGGLEIGPAIAQRTGIPAFVDLQPRAQALGDMLFGHGRGEESFCSLYIGEGIGAGFIIDGFLYRGARGAGGEVGHTAVDASGGICTCGLTGCWETVAATRWLRQLAADNGLEDANSMTAARLADVAEADARGAAMLDSYAANIALGIANLQQTLGLGMFVIHGDPLGGGEPLRAAISAHVERRVFSHPGSSPTIVFADVDDFTTLRGAASIVLSQSLRVTF